jgi:ABC-type oligopeptide transport system substrate-binding subunit
VVALGAALCIVSVGCGSDDDSVGNDSSEETSPDSSSADGNDDSSSSTVAGGEFVDLGTFVGGPPEHIDPALNTVVGSYQVINALYDGLTEIDSSDPAGARIVPLVAETVEPNDEASVWTFTIREGAQFSDGSDINASTFQKSWERAADLAGDYSYLISLIDGGAERLAGDADEISGIEADDETRTLTVTLDAPYSNFDAVAGFQLFLPVPDAAIDAGRDWENELMIGNGPYAMESPRTDEEITLVRNESWQGDFNGELWPDRLEAITFRTQTDPETGFNAFEAGEGDNARIPPGRISDAEANWGTTLDVSLLGSYHFVFNGRDARIGGDENVKLRQAISLAIDRDEINDAVFNGSRTTSTGIVPPGIPGSGDGLCELCSHDPERAQELFEEWVAEGGVQDGPLPIQFNADAGHEPVVALIVDQLAEIGVSAEPQAFPSETYFSELADGACVMCRAGWFADYPTYDNFMFDLFHSSALGGNNYGFTNEEFDRLVDEAKRTIDKSEQAELFQQAERLLLNDETMALPIVQYRGDYAFDPDRVANFPQTNFGLIVWEQVALVE